MKKECDVIGQDLVFIVRLLLLMSMYMNEKNTNVQRAVLKFENRNLSSTLGTLSVLFVASDWGGLRMFQAIVDDRTPPSSLGPF